MLPQKEVCILENYVAFDCRAVNRIRFLMSRFFAMSMGRGRPQQERKCLVGLPGGFLDQKVQLLLCQLLTSPDPRGVSLLLHSSSSSVSSHFLSIKGKPLPPSGKTFALGSHLALRHFLILWCYYFSCISSIQALCHVLLNILEVWGTKKKICLLHQKSSPRVNWDDGAKNVMRILSFPLPLLRTLWNVEQTYPKLDASLWLSLL